MAMECGHRAVLVITSKVEGTSTTVARRRVELTCRLAAGHAGAHHDPEHDEDWDGLAGHRTTLLRDEDEER
jgi:hypothetical protein